VVPAAAARAHPGRVPHRRLGWKRSKWGRVARAYYRSVEGFRARTATLLVTDSRAMQSYYREEWRSESVFLPYGAVTRGGSGASALTRLALEPRGYWLVVTRIEPENNTDLIVAGYLASGSSIPLIVVGGARYESAYSKLLFASAGAGVRFVGPIYDAAALNGLYEGCRAYLHGHEVGGTNPSLLRAMNAGAPCVAIDVEFNREVLGPTGTYFARQPAAVAAELRSVEADPRAAAARGAAARERAGRLYRWDAGRGRLRAPVRAARREPPAPRRWSRASRGRRSTSPSSRRPPGEPGPRRADRRADPRRGRDLARRLAEARGRARRREGCRPAARFVRGDAAPGGAVLRLPADRDRVRGPAEALASAPAPGGGGLPAERQAAAGRELFAAIYGKNDAPVRALLRSFHSEFHDFVLEAAYGRVLTRPGLAAKERELLAAAALAAMAQTPQLVAHARGALRFGATEDEVRGAIALGAAAPDDVEGLLRRVLG
jgi:alkylhydroperoxidase/carboxymuconolactone decarboxylase family protein YurZ